MVRLTGAQEVSDFATNAPWRPSPMRKRRRHAGRWGPHVVARDSGLAVQARTRVALSACRPVRLAGCCQGPVCVGAGLRLAAPCSLSFFSFFLIFLQG